MIRRSAPEDHSWITATAAEVYRDLGDYGAIIPTWLDHPGVLCFVDQLATESRARRGFTLLGFYEPSDVPKGVYVADLLAIAVAPTYQRRGVGRALLTHAIDLARGTARTRNIAEMRLTVAETNVAGRHLFTSGGFHIVDGDHGNYDGGQRAIRMRRWL